MLTSIRIRAWQVAAVAIIATVAVAMVLAASSAEASKRPVNAGVPLAAPYQEPIPAYASYKGWGSVDGYGYGGNARLAVAAPKVAWAWNGHRWLQSQRAAGMRVYIHPYAEGWSWTWTHGTGWLAMRTSDLTIGFRPIAVAT